MKTLLGLVVFLIGLSGGAAMAQGWNSVAVDFEGAQGFAFGVDTEDGAKEQALSTCNNPNCESIFQSQDPCLGVAYTAPGNYYGYAGAKTQDGASTIALGYCIDGGYDTCEVIAVQCVGEVPAAPINGPAAGPGPKTRN